MLRCLTVAVLFSGSVWACSCASPGPPCDAAWKASAVFAGAVVDVTHDEAAADPFLRTRVTFEVTESFIGMEGRAKRLEIRTGMGGGDCGFGFQRGRSYVVYANQHKDAGLIAVTCSRTAAIEDAQADLEYLRSLVHASPFGYVYGLAGIPGVTVSLTGPGKTARLVTGADGAFRFDGLPPGKYSIALAKDGYSLRGGTSNLDLHAGGCAYAWEQLVVDRRVAGKVTDANGRPGANIQVEVVPQRPTEQNQLPFPVAETRTGADGMYELRNLARGEYYLGINLARTPSKETPYTRYFYPGTEDPSAAAIVIVDQGPGTKTYSFPIPEPQKERRVEGFVSWPDGRLAGAVQIQLEDVRWPWQTNTILASTDAAGHFAISTFDQTAYRLHAMVLVRGEWFFVEPLPLGPASDLSKPLRLVLTQKGFPLKEISGKGLERWRAGLGF